jgi:hypothetical protein
MQASERSPRGKAGSPGPPCRCGRPRCNSTPAVAALQRLTPPVEPSGSQGTVQRIRPDRRWPSEIDPLTCPKCQEPMAVIAFIEAEDVIEKILKHLGLWELTPRPPPRSTKSQPLSTEPHIDYSDTQICPSDNGIHHPTLSQNNRYDLSW